MRRRFDHWAIPAGLLALLLGTLACAVGPLPSAGVTPTPCAATCPPPQRTASTPHTVSLSLVRVTYFDPWTVNSSSSHDVVLVAQTDLGQVSVEVATLSVTAGTTAGQLVSRSAQQLLDPNDYSGVQDNGPILGAEIGYVPGAGEDYSATTADPNAPTTPVYLEVMACVRGNVGVIFAALSPLDPSTADPSGAPDQAYDALVNSVRWT
ncbi:MAG: hypothetical protein ACLQUY_23900 [Ktedonobacterales bacterium]